MSDKVLAAVAVGRKETEVREFEMPKIASDEGILKVEIVGVCGTDISYYEHLEDPKILGHHVIGHIEQIGEIASKRWGVKEGDRVAMEEYIPCGQCEACRTGLYRSCVFTDPRSGGVRYGATPLTVKPALFGGFSQYMYLHPNAVLHKLPEHVAGVEAAFILPLSNGFEWMSLKGKVGPGQTVVIQGPGQQGFACALAAKAAGAECVIVTGRTTSEHRLQTALEVGADAVINVQKEDLVQRVHELTNGKMADVVIDVTSGGSGPVTSSINIAKRGGKVIFGAYKYQKLSEFELDEVIKKTLTLIGVRGHGYESVEMAVDCVVSGKFPLSKLNSHNFGLKDVDQALRTAAGEGDPNRLLVTVSPWL